jgi:hypothetical protein
MAKITNDTIFFIFKLLKIFETIGISYITEKFLQQTHFGQIY